MRYMSVLIIGISLTIMAMDQTPHTIEPTKDLKQENEKLEQKLNTYKKQMFQYKEKYYGMAAWAGIAWTIIAVEAFREWYNTRR